MNMGHFSFSRQKKKRKSLSHFSIALRNSELALIANNAARNLRGFVSKDDIVLGLNMSPLKRGDTRVQSLASRISFENTPRVYL